MRSKGVGAAGPPTPAPAPTPAPPQRCFIIIPYHRPCPYALPLPQSAHKHRAVGVASDERSVAKGKAANVGAAAPNIAAAAAAAATAAKPACAARCHATSIWCVHAQCPAAVKHSEPPPVRGKGAYGSRETARKRRDGGATAEGRTMAR